MLFLQFNDEGAAPPCSYIIVVIEDDNLERMKRADLLTFAPESMGGVLRPIKYPANLHMLIAYESAATIGQLYEMYQRSDVQGLVDRITRGWEDLPVDGFWTRMGEGGSA